MKVIEIRRDNRTGDQFEEDMTVEVSWGNKIESDFSVIGSVVSILQHLREHEAAKAVNNHNPVLDRFITIGIRIELED
jgi:hypothetical protein